MIIRRYWRIAVFAPIVGFLIAAGVAIVMTNAGSGETEFRFWFLVLSMANYGVIGLVIALCAMLGGLAAVAILDRQLTKSRRVRTFFAAFGAVVGVMLLSVGVAVALTVLGDAAYAGITIAFGLVFGLAASVVAAVMMLYADWRSR
ncbi:hypothetical protein [Cryobacterium sp. PH31-O1]|uniref:hypothetical protein n=1 Tax=Cryobacterium sp. PH31-O1 TaxID=3046306 RepID=UPI0024B8CCB9|nr:hypothetical protein [Cryobacterium sp. PH31-O1]MDJ0339374.1 hypothetical protein [Cryobacterium sp. PH31-O1]